MLTALLQFIPWGTFIAGVVTGVVGICTIIGVYRLITSHWKAVLMCCAIVSAAALVFMAI